MGSGIFGRGCVVVLLGVVAASAQQGKVITDADYTRAMHQLGPYTAPLVDHAVRSAHWMDDHRFWYIESDHVCLQTVKIGDAAAGTKADAFSTVGAGCVDEHGRLEGDRPDEDCL